MDFEHLNNKVDIEAMQKNFCALFDTSQQTEASKLFKELDEAYQAENRVYHNFEHIQNLLIFLEQHKHGVRDLDGVVLAAWFHDVIYDTRVNDNEEKSAQFAQNYLHRLGVSPDVIMHVIALIRSTITHEVIENDYDSAILLDGDLGILGSSKDEYDQYAEKIRMEYSWVPEEQYRIGRKRVLESFIQRPRIYFTEDAFKMFELRARENITREIALLS